MPSYLQRFKFKPVEQVQFKNSALMQASDFPEASDLFIRTGSRFEDSWQCVVEKSTGRIWAEVTFKG